MSETWTIAQAAVIVEKPLDVFQKVVERAPVRPTLLRRGGRKVKAFALRDLVFLRALDTLKQDLTTRKQAELYDALMRVPSESAAHDVEVGQLRYDFDPYFRLVRAKIEGTRKLLGLIDASGSEPVLQGTTIEAYRIAALLDGMSLEEILRDYPSLDEQQVLAAKAYAEANPKAGRPFPKITAKKAMREARADADAFLPARE